MKKKCYYSEHIVCANSESVKKVNLMSTVVKVGYRLVLKSLLKKRLLYD
jgi:hypothetical protein